MEGELNKLKAKWGVNVCGEGGEYETFTLDCPLYQDRISVVENKIITHSEDAFAPVYLLSQKLKLEAKSSVVGSSHRDMLSNTFVGDLNLLEALNPLRLCQSFCNQVNLKQTVSMSSKRLDLRESVTQFTEQEDDGFYYVSFIKGCGDSDSESVQKAFTEMSKILHAHNSSLAEVVKILMYIDEMDNYASMNSQYVKHFGINPPVRICVAVGKSHLPIRCKVMLSAVGWRGCRRKTLHVQGWSHWAPANIGPYSQGVAAGGKLFISGMIGLVPGTMEMLKCGEAGQARLALRHVERVASVLGKASLNDVIMIRCYVLNNEGASQANQILENMQDGINFKLNASYFIVDQLPRGACVEWEIVMQDPEHSSSDYM